MDLRLADLARHQHGLLTTRQLLRLGLTPSAIRTRVLNGRLYPVHRRVYALGFEPASFDARCLAAVMAAGSDSGLSHRAATALWCLTGEPPEPFDVTTARRTRERLSGVRLHRPRHPPRFTRHRGVPVTTVAQTLLDFATVATQHELGRAIREAHARWLITHQRLRAFAQQAKGRPGAPALREALGVEGASRSRTERAFLALCRRAGLEPPQHNLEVAGELVDFYWPQHNLVVETDGYATHASRHGFEHDHELDAHLARHGIRVQRFTDRQIEGRPDRVLETVCALGIRVVGRQGPTVGYRGPPPHVRPDR